MGLKGHLCPITVAGNRFRDVLGPSRTVPDLRAAKRIKVMQCAGAVFRYPKGIELRQPGIHFCGSLGTGRQLKFQLYTVNGEGFTRLRNLVSGGDKADGSGRLADANAHSQLSGDAGLQQDAVLVVGAAGHGLAGVDIFRHGVLGKAFGYDDGDLPAGKLLLNGQVFVSSIIIGHDTLDTAVVVHVGVGNNDRFHRALAQIFLHQLHGGLSAFHTHQGIEHDPAGIAFNDGQVGHVIAAHLIDTLSHFKQAVSMIVAGILPQTGVNGIRNLLVILQECIRFLTPDHVSRPVRQFQHFGSIDKTSSGVFILAGILKIQQGVQSGIDLDRIAGGIFRLGGQPQLSDQIYAFAGLVRWDILLLRGLAAGCRNEHQQRGKGQQGQFFLHEYLLPQTSVSSIRVSWPFRSSAQSYSRRYSPLYFRAACLSPARIRYRSQSTASTFR